MQGHDDSSALNIRSRVRPHNWEAPPKSMASTSESRRGRVRGREADAGPAVPSSLIDSLLECEICMVEMGGPPIKQCSNGHTLCGACHAKVPTNKCPTCRVPLGNIRCLTAEALAKAVPRPCKNTAGGCTAVLKYDERLLHEQGCDYAALKCLTCNKFEGTAAELEAHYTSDFCGHIYPHKFSFAQDSTLNESIYSCPGASVGVMLKYPDDAAVMCRLYVKGNGHCATQFVFCAKQLTGKTLSTAEQKSFRVKVSGSKPEHPELGFVGKAPNWNTTWTELRNSQLHSLQLSHSLIQEMWPIQVEFHTC